MARILLGVCGGIAAYKAVELVRLAQKAGHSVRVITTPAAERFVGAQTFSGITGAPVLSSDFEEDPLRGAWPGERPPEHAPLSHLELAARADVFLIAPLSANTLAKLATGAADGLLTAAALARPREKPTIVAPAMNNHMYEHAAVQANLATLAQRGIRVLEPDTGPLGSPGEHGIGRLPEPPELLAAIEQALAGAGRLRDLDGLRVLVTAGGTREPIDSVRFIGNRSSGRMGFAVAREAAERGAQVTVVAANVSLDRAPSIAYHDVHTAAELKRACDEHFEAADLLVMAAAVADYRPASAHGGKIKKTEQELSLALERTEDVLSALAARRRPDQLLIGFAAEHGEGALAYGRDKLQRKGLDAVVVNDIARSDIGFDTPENEVTILTASDEIHVSRTDKQQVARTILDVALRLRSASPERVA